MGRLSRRARLSMGSSCVPARLLRACARLRRPASNTVLNFLDTRKVYCTGEMGHRI